MSTTCPEEAARSCPTSRPSAVRPRKMPHRSMATALPAYAICGTMPLKNSARRARIEGEEWTFRRSAERTLRSHGPEVGRMPSAHASLLHAAGN